LSQVDLDSADLRRTDLREANLIQAELDGAVLAGADLRGAHLERSRLRWADLSGVNLEGAYLDDADLEGANLSRAQGAPASAIGCRIYPTTYRESRWTPDTLAEWAERGAVLGDLREFPVAAAVVLLGQEEGLTLYFDKRISGFDRFLIDGVILGVLGRKTTCHVGEFRESKAASIVRITGADRGSLSRVADALFERAWEQQEATAEKTLARLGALYNLDQMAPLLSRLAARIEKMELRLPSSGAQEMSEDQAEEFIRAKDLRLVQTWPQKAARVALRALGSKILGEVDDRAIELVKAGLRLK
jgi:hypothetical protein